MKSRMITLILLTVVLFCCCKKQKCGELSWTDYNTVEDVWCNFKYNKEESRAHLGDTLKVYGLLHYTKTLNINWDFLLLTCCKDIQYTINGGEIFGHPYVMFYSDAFNDSMFPINPYESPLYVSGTISYDPDWPGFFLSTTDIKND